MNKPKKISLGVLAAVATVTIPLTTVISCGDKKEKKGRVLNKFDKIISQKSIQADGWTDAKILEVRENNYNNKLTKIKILTNDFVDYLIQQIKQAKLEEPYKLVHLDLSAYEIDLMGNYFWNQMNIEIKLNEQNSTDKSRVGEVLQTSTIILNLNTTPLATHYTKTFDEYSEGKESWRTRHLFSISKEERKRFHDTTDKLIINSFLDNYLNSKKIAFVLLNNLDTQGEPNMPNKKISGGEMVLGTGPNYGYQVLQTDLSIISASDSTLWSHEEKEPLPKSAFEKNYVFITEELFKSMYK